MADNVQLNGVSVSGGEIIATDDVGGAQHQYVKLEFGGDGTATKVSGSDPLPTVDKGVSATEDSVAGATGSTQLLAANSGRVRCAIRNDSSVALYLSMGGTASTTSPTKLLSQATWEAPCRYTGQVNGIWESPTGFARVLEFA